MTIVLVALILFILKYVRDKNYDCMIIHVWCIRYCTEISMEITALELVVVLMVS